MRPNDNMLSRRTKPTIMIVAIASFLIMAAVLTSPSSLHVLVAAQSGQQKSTASSSQSNTSNMSSASNKTGALGSSKQLEKVLGNNTKIIQNNTNIGNPNPFGAASNESAITAKTPNQTAGGGGGASNQTAATGKK
jgi:hypothetical protein